MTQGCLILEEVDYSENKKENTQEQWFRFSGHSYPRSGGKAFNSYCCENHTTLNEALYVRTLSAQFRLHKKQI